MRNPTAAVQVGSAQVSPAVLEVKMRVGGTARVEFRVAVRATRHRLVFAHRHLLFADAAQHGGFIEPRARPRLYSVSSGLMVTEVAGPELSAAAEAKGHDVQLGPVVNASRLIIDDGASHHDHRLGHVPIMAGGYVLR